MNTVPMETELQALARLLEGWGCPAQRSLEMARQLDRRANQLAQRTGRPKAEAMAHLLRLFQQAAASRPSHP